MLGSLARRTATLDLHLLGSVVLLPGATLWTRDRRLHREADRLGVAAPD